MNQRIREKIYELNSYLKELDSIIPNSLEEYRGTIAVRRGCERLLQISIECLLDILFLTAKEFKLSIPYDESNLIEELENHEIISTKNATKLKEIKGFRNILVHRYGKVDDELVFEYLQKNLDDFNVIITDLEKSSVKRTKKKGERES